jgi:hypothetical protein
VGKFQDNRCVILPIADWKLLDICGFYRSIQTASHVSNGFFLGKLVKMREKTANIFI